MRYTPVKLPSQAEFKPAPTLMESLSEKLMRLRRGLFGAKKPNPLFGGGFFEFRPAFTLVLGGRKGGGKPSRSLPVLVAAGIALSALPAIAEYVGERMRKKKFVGILEELMTQDEFLRQYPKEKIILYADTLYSLNPDLAVHKEVLRSFLKSSLAMDAIDPNFARSVLARKRRGELANEMGKEISKTIGKELAMSAIGAFGG